jgi:hypothetical protein
MCPVDYAAVIAHLVPIFLKESGFWTSSIIHKKSKAVPLHAMEALGGRGGIAPTHS